MDFDAAWFAQLENITPDKVQEAEQYCEPGERRARVRYLRLIRCHRHDLRNPTGCSRPETQPETL